MRLVDEMKYLCYLIFIKLVIQKYEVGITEKKLGGWKCMVLSVVCLPLRHLNKGVYEV